MAGIWTGTTLNTNVLANLMNITYSKEAINVVSESNGLLYLIQKRAKGKINPKFDMAKKAVTRKDGLKLQVKWLNELGTIGTIADGAAENTGVTPSWNDNMFGAGVFDITHFFDVKASPNSEFERLEGQEALTASWAQDLTMVYGLEMDKTISVAINARTAGGTRTTLSSWQHAVSDGTTNVAAFNETLFATYGSIDRSDAGNANLRSYIKDLNGSAFALADLKKGAVRSNRKNPGAKGVDLLLMGEANYLRLAGLLEDKNIVSVTNVPEWAEYGSDYFRYGKMTACLEPELPDDVIGGLDSSTWVEWDDRPGKIIDKAFYDHPTAPTKLTKIEKWYSLICVSPCNNFKVIRCG